MKLIMITGGERSGKSSYAEKLALDLSPNPKYVATSRIWDDEFKKRVLHHQLNRDSRFINIEEEKFLDEVIEEEDVVLIECVSLWLNNFFVDNKNDVEKSLTEAKSVFQKILHKNATIIMVTNEIGLGLHANTPVGRAFTSLLGWMNQHIATKANEVFFLISGIPQKIK